MGRAAVLGALVLAAKPARAQLGPDGSLIRTHDYSVDLYQGPVLASSQVTGLAGAYVAIAEGVDGDPQNPAAPAMRVPWSFDHFDYDLGLAFSLPTALKKGDFFNSGKSKENKDQQLVFLNAAANLQFGSWGFGLTLDLQQYGLDRTAINDPQKQSHELRGQFGVGHLLGAKALADGQLLIGGGLRYIALSVVNSDRDNEVLFTTTGAGLEAGVLWRPNGQPFRVGASFHGAVSTDPNKRGETLYAGTGDNELWLPNQVTLPWDLDVGVAMQLGPRPFNPRWYDPSAMLERTRAAMSRRKALRERYRELSTEKIDERSPDAQAAKAAIDAEVDTENTLDELRMQAEERRVDRALRERVRRMPRSYVLVSSSLLMTGVSNNAVGVESFLDRHVQRSGETVVFSPRLGVESELVPYFLKLRAGSYVEPARFESSSARVHGTMGYEFRVFRWSVFGLFRDDTEWRISGAVDAAKRYFGWGLSIGNWH